MNRPENRRPKNRAKGLLGSAGVSALALLLSGGLALGGGDPPPPSNGVEQGKAVYQQYCQACHGPEGKGLTEQWKQRDALGELPAPPHDPSGHTWRHSDAMLYRMIAEGWRDPFNRTDRLTMPAFGDVLEPGQIDAVIAYLSTLWTEEQRAYQRQQTEKD